jgi:hypothetical protein
LKGLWPAPPLVLLSLVLSLALLSGEAAAQNAGRPKSLIPPARPSGPPEPGTAPRDENLPANTEGLVVHGPGEAGGRDGRGYNDYGGRGTRDGSEQERYYHRDDQTSWPGAASDFASSLAAEYLRGPSPRDGGWEPHLEIILEKAEAGAGARLESEPDVGEREYELTFGSYVLESVLENLEGLAVDSRGLYHLMLREGLPDAGSWLDTPVGAHGGPPSRMTDYEDEEDDYERPPRPVYSVSESPRPNQRQAGRRGANSPSSQGRYSTSP